MMAFSLLLAGILIILETILFCLYNNGKRAYFFASIFATLLLVPTDAMGIISGVAYNMPGYLNISLVGYTVVLAFFTVLLLNAGWIKEKQSSKGKVIIIIIGMTALFTIRIIVDGPGAFSNKMIDGYFLPALLAILILEYLDVQDLPKVLKVMYICIFISALVACVEYVYGRSIFFHDYYMSNTGWYAGTFNATAWGLPFRTTALFGHPLVAGIYYVLGLVYFLNSQHKNKVFSAVQFCVLIAAIFTTNSRGELLCAGAYIIYFLFKEKYYIKLSGITFAGITALSFIDLTSLYRKIFKRDATGGSLSVRFQAFSSVGSIPLATLIFGTGYNNTATLLKGLGFGTNFEVAYLIILAENGLIGFIIWILVLLVLYNRHMIEKVENIKLKSMINGMILCMLAIGATSNSFGDPGTLNYILWAFFAFSEVARKKSV